MSYCLLMLFVLAMQACPNSGTGPGHVSYNDENTKWHDRASQYIISAFGGNSLGQKLIRNPTADLKDL
jgi:hypothetical protein